jgi:hypothetical protein
MNLIIGRKCLGCSLDIWRRALGVILCPEGGYRGAPRVSTLGTPQNNEFALKLKGQTFP